MVGCVIDKDATICFGMSIEKIENYALFLLKWQQRLPGRGASCAEAGHQTSRMCDDCYCVYGECLGKGRGVFKRIVSFD